MSYLPDKRNKSLSKYNNYEETLVVILKSKSQLKIQPRNSIYIEKPSEILYGTGNEFNYISKSMSDYSGIIENDMIDSTETIEHESKIYQFYWMKDKRKLSFEEDKIICITPDSGSGFWLVLDENKNEIQKLYETDIEEIQVKKFNWVATSFLILTGACVIGYIIARNIFTGSSFFPSDTHF